MTAESRLQNLVSATQRAFHRLSALVAGLSFWQFVLFSIILLVAAGIAENFWERPSKSRVHISKDRTASKDDKRGVGAKDKERFEAEIRITEDGIVIRRKAADAGKSAGPPSAQPEAEKSSPPPAGIPDASVNADKDESGSGPGKKEFRIDGVQLTKDDIEDVEEGLVEIGRHTRRPPLASIMFLFVLALFVMRMFARAQQRAEKRVDAAEATADREALQRQLVEARLQILQAQVEPHFLFNTLAAVEHLIETAPPRAAQMQRHLIAYLRAALPRMRQQSATVGQEMELCVSYLRIMQMRMEERLRFDVTVPPGLASASLPPMLLQSLVENSIRHGLEPKPEGGVVNLSAEVRDGKLYVTVADTGLGFSPDAAAGIGLANIRERLQQLFGTDGALTIEPNLPSGTRATIAVPYAVA